MSVLHHVSVSTFLLPNKRFVPAPLTKPVAKAGDEVVLKLSAPAELLKYASLVGKFEDQSGDYVHVHYDGVGTVRILATDLIVM